MNASKFSDAQKAFILKQGADGVPVVEILPQGRHQSGDLLQLEEALRRPVADRDAALKQLEDENTKLRELVDELRSAGAAAERCLGDGLRP